VKTTFSRRLHGKTPRNLETTKRFAILPVHHVRRPPARLLPLRRPPPALIPLRRPPPAPQGVVPLRGTGQESRRRGDLGGVRPAWRGSGLRGGGEPARDSGRAPCGWHGRQPGSPATDPTVTARGSGGGGVPWGRALSAATPGGPAATARGGGAEAACGGESSGWSRERRRGSGGLEREPRGSICVCPRREELGWAICKWAGPFGNLYYVNLF